MAQKKLKRYRINWEGKSIHAAMVFLGLSFFLRLVYYFGFVAIEEVGFWELLTWLILPMMLEASVIVLLRIMKLNSPGLYSILAAAMGLLLILQSIESESVVRVILSALANMGCAVLIVGVAGGYLSKQIGVTAYVITALVRFFAFEMGQYVFSFRIVGFVKEVTGLFVLLALVGLTNSFKEIPRKKKTTTDAAETAQ